jgi:hypothetical protein
MKVAERPWWTTRSLVAVIFVVGSVAGFLLQVVLPLKSGEHISKDQQKTQERISDKNRRLQIQLAQSQARVAALDRRVGVSELLLDHFFGKDAREQTAVVKYMRYQFRSDFQTGSLQAILTAGAHPKVKPVIVQSLASAGGVGQSGLNAAVREERAGFGRLIAGDLVGAKKAFAAAYNAFPTYHNVDEISNKVLAGDLVAGYARADSTVRRAHLKHALSKILTAYSWGIPSSMRPRLQAKLKALG